MSYGAPDRFDITRKSGDERGQVFAPSIGLLYRFHPKFTGSPTSDAAYVAYHDLYLAEMRRSYQRQQRSWAWLLGQPELTLVCYCTDPTRCHRTILAHEILPLVAARHGIEYTFIGERDDT